MSDTYRFSAQLQAVISGQTISGTAATNGDMTGTRAMNRIVKATTTDATLPLTDFDNVGQVMLTNLDPTNSILVDAVNTYNAFPQTLLAGKSIILAPATTTIHFKSSAGTPLLEMMALEI